MSGSTIAKLIMGILVLCLLVVMAIMMVNGFANVISGLFDGDYTAEDSEEYYMETPEPQPTMPDYMADDSFYDDLGGVDLGD